MTVICAFSFAGRPPERPRVRQRVADEAVLEVERRRLDDLALLHRRAPDDQLDDALAARSGAQVVEPRRQLLG